MSERQLPGPVSSSAAATGEPEAVVEALVEDPGEGLVVAEAEEGLAAAEAGEAQRERTQGGHIQRGPGLSRPRPLVRADQVIK